MCPVCGVPYAAGVNHVCSACSQASPGFTTARAVGVYAGPLRRAVHEYKYRMHRGLARPLGRALANAYQAFYGPGTNDLAIPVPLHVSRLRYRGFNQAFLLLPPHSGARGWDIPVQPRALVRVKRTKTQLGLSARERVQNLKGAFAVPDPALVKGKRVLLVDDVYTTGATARACAKVLFAAGAQEVNVLTLARVGW